MVSNFALATLTVLHPTAALETSSDEKHNLTLLTCPYADFYVVHRDHKDYGKRFL